MASTQGRTRHTAAEVLTRPHAWGPSYGVLLLLLVWVGLWISFVKVGIPWWEQRYRTTSCPRLAHLVPARGPGLGTPPSGATITATIGIARGVGVASTTWPVGPGAPTSGTYQATSSPLVLGTGTHFIGSESVHPSVQIDNGRTIVQTCIDAHLGNLPSGTYAGYVAIPTLGPTRTLTVREQLDIQAPYVADFWPLGVLVVGFAFMLGTDSKSSVPWPQKWFVLGTGVAAFTGSYYASALANPTWGGAKAVGTLLATLFTATTGAAATAGRLKGSSSPSPGHGTD